MPDRLRSPGRRRLCIPWRRRDRSSRAAARQPLKQSPLHPLQNQDQAAWGSPSTRTSLGAIGPPHFTVVAAPALADRPDLVLIDKKIGLTFASDPDHGVVEILDPPGNALAVTKLYRHSHLL